MLVLFPLAAAVVLVYLHWRGARQWREAIVSGAVAWGALVLAGTEALSLVRGITRGGVAGYWAAVLVVLMVLAARRRRRRGGVAAEGPSEPAGRMTAVQRGLVACVAVIVGALLVVAVMAPPNTWDAMTYHMPRVVFWMQNHTVSHFPTHVARQDEYPPFAEYVITHFQILTGGDRLANVPQWLAMVGCITAGSLIAKRLGAGVHGQILTAVVCVTVPTIILEATGAKNDCVVAFWLACATLSLLDLSRAGGRPWPDALRFGLAIGLAMATKATVYILGWPVLAVLAVAVLWRHRWRVLAPLAVAGCMAIAMNVPHLWRTYRVFGDLFGSPQSHRLMENKRIAGWILVSNALRNTAVHLATPSTWVNEHVIYDPVVRVHEWMGKDPSDAASTIDPRFYAFQVRWSDRHEDHAGAAVHVVLILAYLLVVGLIPRLRRRPLALGMTAALVMGYLTFCLLINWQPWHPRYHLVLLVLWAPVLGMFLEAVPRPVGYGVVLALLAWAVPFVLWNPSRPMLGERNVFVTPRVAQYFANRPELLTPYRQVAAAVGATKVQRVAFLSGGDSWIYPMQVLLRNRLGARLRVDFANGFDWPTYGKVRMPEMERAPESTLVVFKSRDWDLNRVPPRVLVERGGASYGVAQDFGPLAIFVRGAERELADKAFFEKGWYGVERTEWGWGAWTSSTGTLVLSRPADGAVSLEGVMISSRVPNDVTIRVNGTDVAKVRVGWQYLGPFDPVRLPLRKGDNVIEVVSGQPPVRDAGDGRDLGVLVGNLAIREAAGAAPEVLKPIAAGRQP